MHPIFGRSVLGEVVKGIFTLFAEAQQMVEGREGDESRGHGPSLRPKRAEERLEERCDYRGYGV